MMKGDDAEVYVDNSADSKWAPLPPQEIIARAKSKEGQSEYGLLHYNCESFVNWCRYNKTESDQVNTVGKLVKILGGAALGMLGSSST
ncbi:hypothetical protein RRG08_015149 [Elysia crispata]|uniref:LRAT domain-containing protein n=1 Tax=Elysia crispata TaxID=231223 RepID=A0AAE1E7F7_9GAST|nr:hypothetical protein RRG08_015149 [Elysia crispata]